MRGTLAAFVSSGASLGLIPAGAGNTYSPPAICLPRAAHPRRCGEHSMLPADSNSPMGSSPQVRGTHQNLVKAIPTPRLIPAGAGNTTVAGCNGKPRGAHPRRCGEHTVPGQLVWVAWGSSPQVRGTPRSAERGIPGERLIPAGAGNTVVNVINSFSVGAHPRRCGEHSW